MCCFTRPVEQVKDTQIFARLEPDGRQVLVYSMYMIGREELAMVLPIPVRPGSPDDAVSFVDLSNYPAFFNALWLGFDHPRSGGGFGCAATPMGRAPLPVVRVGSFEASFVPTVDDFSRLDPRFQLPVDAWDNLPGHRDHGFAVFKLKPGEQRVHPMVFLFPTRQPDQLFFPTVHIHDGRVRKLAEFDHHLFCQTNGLQVAAMTGWKESRRPARLFMPGELCGRVLDGERHCYYRRLQGRLKNRDTWVA